MCDMEAFLLRLNFLLILIFETALINGTVTHTSLSYTSVMLQVLNCVCKGYLPAYLMK